MTLLSWAFILGGGEPDLIKLVDTRPQGIREIVDAIEVPELDLFFGDSANGQIKTWKESQHNDV